MVTAIDLSTIYLFGVLVCLLLSGLMCFAYLRLTTYEGFRSWLLSIACYTLGLLMYWLISLRASSLELVVGNLFFVAAPSLALLGTARFFGRRIGTFAVWAPVLVGFVVAEGFVSISENRTLRISVLSAVIVVTQVVHIWILRSDRPKAAIGSAASCLVFFVGLYLGYLVLRVGFITLGYEAHSAPWVNNAFQAVTYAITSLSNVGMVFGYLALTYARTETRLLESEMRYRILIDQSPDSITVHRDGIVIFANPAAFRMFGVETPQSLIGRPYIDRIHPSFHKQVFERRKRISEQGIGGPLTEMQYVKIDGTIFFVETQSAPIIYDGANATQIISHDITAIKRAAVERKEFERKLQETQKLESLGLLAGGIAHDFNNILTGILGNASLASLELPFSSPIGANLRSIQEGSRRAADLCKQLLAYSGRGFLVVQKISLNRLVEETAHLLKLSIGKNSTLNFNFHPNLPAIQADETQVRQVIMNLVINASDAIGGDSGAITLTTGVTNLDRKAPGDGGLIGAPELTDGPYVFLEVSDTGCGMSPETQAKIFDPFFTTKFTGRGLGLSSVLGIIRSHKGALMLVSEPGRGTTFKLLFPRVAGEAETDAVEKTTKAMWRGQGCVLVVDDEESVRTTAAAILGRLGFDVILAVDGIAGIEAFKEKPERFALVLMDLTMPKMEGRKAFAEIKRIRGDIPVILMSGLNEFEGSQQFPGQETAGFLQKPFGLDDLIEALRAALPK
jgi:two-component system cell cycle sensor histidine kinase/response regulator CckA